MRISDGTVPQSAGSTQSFSRQGFESSVFGEATHRDVKVYADHALGFSGVVVEYLAVTRNPADASAGGANAILHRPVVELMAEEFVELKDNAVAILGMQARKPFFAAWFFVQREIANPLESVGPINSVVDDVPVPHSTGDNLLCDAESLLIGQQLLLCNPSDLRFIRGLQDGLTTGLSQGGNDETRNAEQQRADHGICVGESECV